MLVLDFRQIGNTIYNIRKSKGLSRAEVAEKAGLSDRTFADIERGSVNMRIETALKICSALNVTPNKIFTKENNSFYENSVDYLFERLNKCTSDEKQTALRLLSVYLDSLSK